MTCLPYKMLSSLNKLTQTKFLRSRQAIIYVKHRLKQPQTA